MGLEPWVSTKGDHYLVRVGAGLYVDAQGEPPPSTSSHRPTRSYSLFDDILMPYAGLEGERQPEQFPQPHPGEPLADRCARA